MRRGWVLGMGEAREKRPGDEVGGQGGVLNAGAPGDAHITVIRALWPRTRIGSGAKWQKKKK